MISTQQIRQVFIDFFQSKNHMPVASSSLVPGDDPTLLFTNAGMVQFKDVFLGTEQRTYQRAVTAQRCVRAGGKHNDLENVGYTARHHTFFEMLGNFSFGDYFKKDAILYAWELLTVHYQLPKDKLWVTVYHTDDEAYAIWQHDIGIPQARIIRIGDKAEGGSDNFWQMGETGPCGPCSEIFYDHGDTVAGGPPGSAEEDGDRYIEIWNLVFMQFNRDAQGVLHPLPKPSVDTGMGLERLAAVLQHVHSNYQIDLFANLIKAAAKVVDTTDLNHNSLKVIVDHIRSCAFLIVDGVQPSNEGRGYVLRRILRRAVRHGYKLGQTQPFFYQLIQPLLAEMGEAYPELTRCAQQVERIILQEEQRFAETLEHGMRLLETDISTLTGRTIAGETIFKLYDTFGFPVDLTNDIAREQGLSLDMAGFEKAMQAQRDRARAASQFTAEKTLTIDPALTVAFTGYTHCQEQQATVLALYQEGESVTQLNAPAQAIVILDRTPFYAESGGQIGDSGILNSAQAQFAVSDTQKQSDKILHLGELQSGSLKVGDILNAAVDVERRQAIALNHSATHLLHAALRQVVGEHVTQKGSLVDAERLRFDFTHSQPVTPNQLAQITLLVNEQIRKNHHVSTTVMAIDEATAKGAMALFGEKYGETVRVIEMGDFSLELCGGTHVTRAGDIGLFQLISETGVASGVRRIEATTGNHALILIQQQQLLLNELSHTLKTEPSKLTARIDTTLKQLKKLEKERDVFKEKCMIAQSNDLLKEVKIIAETSTIVHHVLGADAKTLRFLVDQLKDRLHNAVIVLASVSAEGNVSLIAGVTASLTQTIKAGELVNIAAIPVGGKGGGRPDMATAGGHDATQLPAALQKVQAWLCEHLQKRV